MTNPATEDRCASLLLDDIITNGVIKEDGNTINISQLKEWDVISVILNSDNQCIEFERIVPVESYINLKSIAG